LSWTLDEKRLAKRLRIPRVALINDLVAHAEGTNVLRPSDMIVLQPGKPQPRGNRAIIAAGTGLSEAGLTFDESIAGQTAFAAHGPASIRKMLKEIPIRLIRSPENALYGAAHYASRLKV